MTVFAARRPRLSLSYALLPLAFTALLSVPVLPGFAQDTAAPAADAAAPAADAAVPAADAAAPSPDAVVATVGDEPITEGDLSFAAEDLGQELSQIPPTDRRAFLVTVLIDMKVMAQAARTAGLDQSDVFKQRLGYLEDRALRRAYFAEKVAAAVTEDSLHTAYDAYVASFQPTEEVHAKHILVATKEDADAIEAELKAGKPFEVLAMEKSLDPGGAQNGGDLGFFSRGMMVKPFEDAAFALTDVGQVSEPIQSQFGWHVIKLEEKRQSAPKTFEEMAPELQQQVMFTTFDSIVGDLKKNITVTIPDAALAAAVQTQSEDVPE